jgi:hypothetical protein
MLVDYIFNDIEVGDWVAFAHYGNHQLGIGTVTQVRELDIVVHKEHRKSGLMDITIVPSDCIVITGLVKNNELDFNRRHDYQNSIFFDISGQPVEKNDWIFYYDVDFRDVMINKVSEITASGITTHPRPSFRSNGGWYSSYQIINITKLPRLFRYLMEKHS